jgi:hypothetical protein
MLLMVLFGLSVVAALKSSCWGEGSVVCFSPINHIQNGGSPKIFLIVSKPILTNKESKAFGRVF